MFWTGKYFLSPLLALNKSSLLSHSERWRGGGEGGRASLYKEVLGTFTALFNQDTMNKIVDLSWCENRKGKLPENGIRNIMRRVVYRPLLSSSIRGNRKHVSRLDENLIFKIGITSIIRLNRLRKEAIDQQCVLKIFLKKLYQKTITTVNNTSTLVWDLASLKNMPTDIANIKHEQFLFYFILLSSPAPAEVILCQLHSIFITNMNEAPSPPPPFQAISFSFLSSAASFNKCARCILHLVLGFSYGSRALTFLLLTCFFR